MVIRPGENTSKRWVFFGVSDIQSHGGHQTSEVKFPCMKNDKLPVLQLKFRNCLGQVLTIAFCSYSNMFNYSFSTNNQNNLNNDLIQ